jgi:LysR family transcriptional regulator AphB
MWRLRRGLEVKEVRVESRVSVPDPAISQQLALTGVGIALLSQSAARRHVQDGRLIRLLPEWEPEPVELYALYASRLNSSPKVRAFVQFMKQQLGVDPVDDLVRSSESVGKFIRDFAAASNQAN